MFRITALGEAHGRLGVTPDVVAVRMGVDDDRDRLVGQGLDLLQQRLTPAWILGVDDNQPLCGDADQRVCASARYEEESGL
jgi:hypothetical protein